MRKTIQAKHLAAEAVIEAVRATRMAGTNWSSTWDVYRLLPSWPPKIVCAKLGALVRSGRLRGNPYPRPDDRGDFEVAECQECGTELGHKLSCSIGAALSLDGDPKTQTVRNGALVERR